VLKLKEQGSCGVEEIFALIEGEAQVRVRIAAVYNKEIWQCHTIEVTTGEKPESWCARRWKYPEALFLDMETTGAQLLESLHQGEIAYDQLTIDISGLLGSQSFSWHKYASRFNNAQFERLEWPSIQYRSDSSAGNQLPQPGTLISDDTPSFWSFLDAVVAFFGIATNLGYRADQVFILRVQDKSGRISKIRIEDSTIGVLVEGTGLEGAKVELAIGADFDVAEISGDDTQEVEFRLPSSLPPHAYVVLKRGSEWLDRKLINSSYGSERDEAVEVVEPTAEVEMLVAYGEGPQVEFKRDVKGTQKQDDYHRKICRTVAAFANGDGGHIIFGVADDGDVVGVDTESRTIEDLRDDVTRSITDMVDPLPPFRVDRITLSDKPLLVVRVERGPHPPYGVDKTKPTFYVRRGATTFPASVQQVHSLAQGNVSSVATPAHNWN
jgi:hypothetical protein